MSDNTTIEWCDASFNPWWGCQKVSPGCLNCYAERDARRYAPTMTLWGDASTRRLFGEQHWSGPLKWNRKAAKEGKRIRVFCASMADVFDKDAPVAERAKLMALVRETPNLDWLMLTKRVGNVMRMIEQTADWHFDHGDRNVAGWLTDWYRHGIAPTNVWLGASVVNQDEVDRDVPKLLATPAAVRFLSCEPLLEQIFVGEFLGQGIDWLIVGGESGPKARPFHVEWARTLVAQCRWFGVAPFVKQMGAVVHDYIGRGHDWPGMAATFLSDKTASNSFRHRLADRKGGDVAEWPESLRIREFPRSAA